MKMNITLYVLLKKQQYNVGLNKWFSVLYLVSNSVAVIG